MKFLNMALPVDQTGVELLVFRQSRVSGVEFLVWVAEFLIGLDVGV